MAKINDEQKAALDNIKALAAKNPGKTLFEYTKEYLQDDGNMHGITAKFGGNINAFYLAMADTCTSPADADAFKALAVRRFFVNDVAGFLERMRRKDDKAHYSCNVFMQRKSQKDMTPVPVKFKQGTLSYIGARTGRGKTSTVFWVNLFGNALNIALDPVLIFGWCGCPRLGIAGAAYATVFSMALQWMALVLAARREKVGSPAAAEETGMRELVLRMLRFGVPAGCYNVLNCLSFTIFVFVTGGVGELELAVSNACFTVNYLLFAPMEGFSIGASTLVAQAIGRGDEKAASRAARRTVSLGVGFAALLSFLALTLAHPVLSLFVSSELAADASALGAFHSLGFTLFAMMAAWQVFDAADVIVSGALKGAGDTKFVMLWMMFGAFALWLPGVFVVRHVHNTMPALWATMIAYVVVLCAGTFIRWRCGAWRKIKLV